MRSLLSSALLAAAVMLGGSATQAFTVPAQNAAPDSNIERVAGGCGPGWVLDRSGNCRPGAAKSNFNPRRCFQRQTPWGPRQICR